MSRSKLGISIAIGLSVAIGLTLLRAVTDGNDWRRKTEPRLELLNVSYDPTRELWRDLNERFSEHYFRETGKRVVIAQSHGGSSSQARAVIDGLQADVVSLALPSDTDAIRQAGLIEAGWEDRLPNRSTPYYSTIVFVVRLGNPKAIRDWPDLIRPNVEVITPSPKTSGNGKLTFLAAWGSVLIRGGSQADAQRYVTDVYRHVPILDTGARAATGTFVHKRIGDVHVTWENEARLEVEESSGTLEIVYPPISIRAAPKLAWVDANVRENGTQALAEAYLRFVYSDEAQEVLARKFYRPIDAGVLHKYASSFPSIQLFNVEDISQGWDDANRRFFGTGGLFDQIYAQQR
jgi:sulfate/thiosulfate transport system substrate-binding protein